MKQNPMISKAGCVASTPSHPNTRGTLAAPLDPRSALVKGGERHA